jgi:hypothetical protein
MQVCKIGGHFENGRHLGSDTKIEVANGFVLISSMYRIIMPTFMLVS